MEQAVDGADIEGAVTADEGVHSRLGPGRRPELLLRRAVPPACGGEGVILEAGKHALAHFGGGLVGEGDGQDLLPAVGSVGLGQGTAGRRFFPRSAGSPRQQGKEGAGKGVGLAGTGRGFYLAEFVHAAIIRYNRRFRKGKQGKKKPRREILTGLGGEGFSEQS